MSITRAIADAKRFSQAEFAVEVSFTTPDKVTTVKVKALASRHHNSFDPDTGIPVNSRNVHISVCESVLTDAGYTVRDAKGEVALRGHIVTWTDAVQTVSYKILETMTSDTFGLIPLILGGYE
jgi:hypothetical protein